MKKNNHEMDIVFLLDRSGSMQGLEKDTIGGYNSYLSKQRQNKIKTNITTVLFDDQYEIINHREDIKTVKNLNNKDYYVRGSTALLDAIGKTISLLEPLIKNNNKVLFVITTDGLENSSIEYSKKQIQKMINKHSDWEFLYIGANIDSYQEGTSIGLKKTNIANYCSDTLGTEKMFKAVDRATANIIKGEKLNNSWKKDLN